MSENAIAAPPQPSLDTREIEAIEYVKNLKGFHMNWLSFLVIVPALGLLNFLISPEVLWVTYVIIPWIIAIVLHALTLFGLFGLFNAEWEQREFKKRMR